MSSNLGNLARHVSARRDELDRTQLDVWQEGGPSNSTLTAIEAGKGQPSAATLRKLDVGLRWKAGSARAVLAGGEPTPLPDDDGPGSTPTLITAISDAVLIAELARRLERGSQRAGEGHAGSAAIAVDGEAGADATPSPTVEQLQQEANRRRGSKPRSRSQD